MRRTRVKLATASIPRRNAASERGLAACNGWRQRCAEGLGQQAVGRRAVLVVGLMSPTARCLSPSKRKKRSRPAASGSTGDANPRAKADLLHAVFREI
jgi:hypothetical protein